MRSRIGLARLEIVLLVGFLLSVVPSAEALDRFVDGNSGNDAGNDCDNAASPCLTIGQAVSSSGAGDVIQIADAVYTEILTIPVSLTLRGESRGGTIIEAAANRGSASDRTISVDDDVDLELSDLTIRHGNTGLNGGGLRIIGGDLVIERVTFTSNDADGQGAGLASGDNVVVMNDVVFRDNGSSQTSNGGGAFLGVNFQATDVTLTNVVFENNTASVGGGLDLMNTQTQATDVAFAGNVVDNDGGGLSYRGSNSVDSTLILTNAMFIGNQATSQGGGMYIGSDDTPFTIINALFSGNLADLGGGLYNETGLDQAGLDEGGRVLTNVTITGNRAMGNGGRAGGIVPRVMRLRNTIIWNNQDESGIGTAKATMDDFFSSDILEVSNSLLQGYPAGEFPGNGSLDGTNAANDPQFVTPVSPVGAPNQQGNLRLGEDSPLIDEGNDTFVSGVSTDLDGFDRIVGASVDLGAYESGNDVLFQDRFEP